jgi:hypothetical protein
LILIKKKQVFIYLEMCTSRLNLQHNFQNTSDMYFAEAATVSVNLLTEKTKLLFKYLLVSMTGIDNCYRKRFKYGKTQRQV